MGKKKLTRKIETQPAALDVLLPIEAILMLVRGVSSTITCSFTMNASDAVNAATSAAKQAVP